MIISSVCVLGGAAFLNFVVDPAQLFHAGYERQLAVVIAGGHSVADVSPNYDDRLLQKFITEESKATYQVIAIGSSRVMTLNDSLFFGKTFFNHGVSGATLEDLLAIVELYEQKGRFPETIVIGLDPWILNRETGAKSWMTLSGEYRAMRRRLGLVSEGEQDARVSEREMSKLLSGEYAKASISALLKGHISREFRVVGNAVSNLNNREGVYFKRADGMIVYPADMLSRTRAEIRSSAVAYVARNPVYMLNGFASLDIERREMFERLIDHLKMRKVAVSFFLPPYHGMVYSSLMSNAKYSIIEAAQAYFEGVARERDIRVAGSYNPGDCALDESDFIDGMHMTQAATERVFSLCARIAAGANESG